MACLTTASAFAQLEQQLNALRILDGSATQWPGVTEAAEQLRAAGAAAEQAAQAAQETEAAARRQAEEEVARARAEHAIAEGAQVDAEAAAADARALSARLDEAGEATAARAAERDAARQDCEGLKSDIEGLRSELEDERQRNSEMERQLAYAEGELEGLRVASAEAGAVAKAAAEEAGRCRAAMDASVAITNQHQGRVEELLEERARLEAALTTAEARLEDQDGALSQARRTNLDVSNASAAGTKRWGKELEALKVKLAASQEREQKAAERAEASNQSAGKAEAVALAGANAVERLRREDADKTKRWGEQLTSLHERAAVDKTRIASLEGDLKTLRDAEVAAKRAASAASAARDTLKAELEGVAKERDDHSLRIKAMAIDLRSAKADIARFKADTESRQQALAQLQQESAAATKRWGSEVASLREAEAGASRRAAAAEAQVGASRAAASSAKLDAEAKAKAMAAIQSDLAASTKRWSTDVTRLKGALKEAEAAKAGALAAAKKAAADAKALQVKVETTDQALALAQAAHAQATKRWGGDVQRSRAEAVKAQHTSAALEAELTANAKGLLQLEADKTEKAATVESLSAELERAHTARAEAESAREAAGRKAAAKEASAGKLKGEIERLKGALARGQADHAVAVKRWGDEAARLKGELGAKGRELEAAEARVASAQKATRQAGEARAAKEKALTTAQAEIAAATVRWSDEIVVLKKKLASAETSATSQRKLATAAAKRVAALEAGLDKSSKAQAAAVSSSAVTTTRWAKEVELAKAQAAELRERLAESERHREALSEARMQLSAKCAAAEQSKTQALASQAAATKRWAGSNEALQAKVAALEADCGAYKSRLEAAAAELKGAREALGLQRHALDKEKAAALAARRRHGACEEKLLEAERLAAAEGKRADVASTELESMRTRLSEYQAALSEERRRAEGAAMSARAEHLTDSKKAQAEVERLQAAISAKDAKGERILATAENRAGKVERLEAEVARMGKEAERTTIELRASGATAEGLRAEFAMVKRGLETAEATTAGEKARAESLVAEVRAEQLRVSALNSQLKEERLAAEASRLRFEKDAAVASAMASSWERELAKSEAERRAMRERVDRAEAEMGELRRLAAAGLAAATAPFAGKPAPRPPSSLRKPNPTVPLSPADTNAPRQDSKVAARATSPAVASPDAARLQGGLFPPIRRATSAPGRPRDQPGARVEPLPRWQ